MQRCVEGSAQRGGGYELDAVVVGEGVAEGAALFVAEVCEGGVVDYVVCCCEVVDALLLLVSFMGFWGRWVMGGTCAWRTRWMTGGMVG